MTKEQKKYLRELAHEIAGVRPGQKIGRWTHEEREALCYAVLFKLYNLSK
jgi:hypothetical protein